MVRENKKLDWMLIVSIFIVLFSILLFIFSLNLNNFISLQVKKVPITVTISDHSGINVSKDQNILHLGNVKKNTFGSRDLIITNDYNFPTLFEFDVDGDIEDLLIYKQQILFEPYENKNVTFKTKIIEDEEYGDYSGVITLRIKRVPQ